LDRTSIILSDGAVGSRACAREQRTLLVATLMHLSNPLARAVWTAFAPKHRRVLHHLVKEAGKRARGDAADN
jgi:hypothetical protein